MCRIDWKQAAAITVSVAGAFGLLYFVGRYAIALFLPFLIALGLSVLTHPAVEWLALHTRVPRRVLAALVTLGALLLIGGIGYVLIARLLGELQRLLLFLAEDGGEMAGAARVLQEWRDLVKRFPLVERLRRADLFSYFIGDTEAFFEEQLRTVLTRLSARVTELAGAMLRRLPSLLLFLLVSIISCFYFAMDQQTVYRGICRVLPVRISCRLPALRLQVGAAVRRYLRAYFLLFLLTLAELTVGLLILGVDYAFLLALITAILDVLPVLGVGTVLLPFALICFVGGGAARGAGVLILYAVITIVRQIAEPRLVGKSLGLHPVLMLVCFYVGWRLFGVAGVFIGPAVAVVIKTLADQAVMQTE